MCMINGAIIVHRETINLLLHMVWCPLTCPTNNAKQRSCNRVFAGFRLCTKESILIIYSDTNLKVVFFFPSFQLASIEFFLWPVRLDSCRHLYYSRIGFLLVCLEKGSSVLSFPTNAGKLDEKHLSLTQVSYHTFLIYVLLIQLAVEYI